MAAADDLAAMAVPQEAEPAAEAPRDDADADPDALAAVVAAADGFVDTQRDERLARQLQAEEELAAGATLYARVDTSTAAAPSPPTAPPSGWDAARGSLSMRAQARGGGLVVAARNCGAPVPLRADVNARVRRAGRRLRRQRRGRRRVGGGAVVVLLFLGGGGRRRGEGAAAARRLACVQGVARAARCGVFAHHGGTACCAHLVCCIQHHRHRELATQNTASLIDAGHAAFRGAAVLGAGCAAAVRRHVERAARVGPRTRRLLARKLCADAAAHRPPSEGGGDRRAKPSITSARAAYMRFNGGGPPRVAHLADCRHLGAARALVGVRASHCAGGLCAVRRRARRGRKSKLLRWAAEIRLWSAAVVIAARFAPPDSPFTPRRSHLHQSEESRVATRRLAARRCDECFAAFAARARLLTSRGRAAPPAPPLLGASARWSSTCRRHAPLLRPGPPAARRSGPPTRAAALAVLAAARPVHGAHRRARRDGRRNQGERTSARSAGVAPTR